jgi:hypothetical protein
MKEEAKADPDLAAIFKAETAAEIIVALKASGRGRRFIDERVVPYQKEYGWHAVWSHEFIFPTVREQMEPVIELVRGYIETNYDYPKTISALAADIDAAAKEILEGLDGEALEEMRAANEINLRMAPLTPDHHFYIDQGANAHVRLPLIAIGRKLVAAGALDAPDDVVFFKYNELRVFIGNPAGMDGRALVAEREADREKAYTFRPKEWIGTVTATQLAFPYLNLWGFPDKFYRKESAVAGQVTGIGASPGVVEGIARVVLREDQFDDVRAGDVLVCQMTNPAWVVLFTKIVGLVTDAGGTASSASRPSSGRPWPPSGSGTATGSGSTEPPASSRSSAPNRPARQSESGPDRGLHDTRCRDLAQRPERSGQGPPAPGDP